MRTCNELILNRSLSLNTKVILAVIFLCTLCICTTAAEIMDLIVLKPLQKVPSELTKLDGEDKLDEEDEVYEIDINSDGKREYIAVYRKYCGAGSCPYGLLINQGTGFKSIPIGDCSSFFVERKTTGGYFNIICGTRNSIDRLSWNSKEYVIGRKLSPAEENYIRKMNR